MPVDVFFEQVPMGIAAQDASGVEGNPVRIAIREFSSSEDGEDFIQRLEGLPNQILNKVSHHLPGSLVDHLVAIIQRDGRTTVYINECKVFIKARMGRSVKAQEMVFEEDLVDIDELVFEGVEFPPDAGVVCVMSAGWRKGLFFDLGPLGPEKQLRDYAVSKVLGSRMAYLRSQGVFRLAQDDWDYLLEHQWFPFMSLGPPLRSKLVRFAKSRSNLDSLLQETSSVVLSGLEQMLNRWKALTLLESHIDLLTHAARRFEAKDFVSATAILYPRIEGVMRTLHLTVGGAKVASQTNLASAVIDARANEQHEFTLTLPEMFRRYLKDAYFAAFVPGERSPVSRNSVGHGVAAPSQFDEKAALLGLLTLDQISFFLPAPIAEAEQTASPSPASGLREDGVS